MQRNGKKFREMQRHAGMQRYPHDLHGLHVLCDLHDNVIFDILELKLVPAGSVLYVED